MPQNTSVWLNVLRALAAQAVVLGHLYQLFFFGDHLGTETFSTTLLHKAIVVISAYSHDAVTFFFVISGYLVGGQVINTFKTGSFSWTRYLENRLIRLWIVLIPCLFLTLAIDKLSIALGDGARVIGEWRSLYPANWLADEPWSVARFVANAMFFTRAPAPMFGTNLSLWSLTNEFWYYMLLPAIGSLLSKRSRSKVPSLIVACGLSIFLWQLLDGLTVPFFVGFGIWMLGAAIRYIPFSTRSAAAVALVALASGYAAANFPQPIESTARDLVTALLASSLIYLSRLITCESLRKPSDFFSKYSYSLYAIHLPILVFLMSMDPLTSLTKSYGLSDLLRFFGYAAVCNGLALLFWIIFERRTDALKIALRGQRRSVISRSKPGG